ncbi:MAG: peptide MFS transporter [Bacteroidia bacterium]|nr:peptide MFS transporter [Bacteroidia bacterium]NNF32182.1 peptide MFS transporter [Flavobacteriaceae bacterium]MBT8276645.1 peptide MFS transporter [Bacteroidia bacterium]NNJ82885.1 peptide MFS transporter [Flavobacteriaceae bacterium]NNK55103.1 peptide MFS transporter [Flavobacteriaceae bacterium]
MTTDKENFFENKVLGHPAGLFVLFFTEMWERFSYYGMRAILVIFLTGALLGDNPGWEWSTEAALSLLGTYAMLVYLTPLLGGWLADNKIGYRMAVVIGALLMTMGHASMAVETPTFLYIGIALLILGNGFFKPNMTSIISKMYEGHDEKKDGAYNIFYMGVNAGAFLGIMLCGWVGEVVGWSYGFGLAGVFMLLGMLQFYFAQPLFGNVGDKPKKKELQKLEVVEDPTGTAENEAPKLNNFRIMDVALIVLFTVSALIFIINDPLSKIGDIQTLNFDLMGMTDSLFFALLAAVTFIVLLIIRLPRYIRIERDRMIAFAIFCVFTVFFWAAFEQAAGSMPIYIRDFTSRVLEGNAAMGFKIVDLIVTVVPLLIITYVLWSLFKKTFSRIGLSNIILGFSFVIVWAIVIYKLYVEFQATETEVKVTWFAILNSLFIIMFAPLFTKWWDSKYNPPASVKYFLGLALLGIGFAFLAFGARNVMAGAESASLSMAWVVLAYLFHTLGELCLSPMGLSYLSKLIPARMIAFMFGVYYLAIAIGNKLAHYVGGDIERITEEYSLSTFFLIFTIIPIALGLVALMLHPLLKRMMHGVR